MSFSHVQLFETPCTVTCQAPLSMGFLRQEYRSALPFPSPGDLPDPGIEPMSPALQADALPSEPIAACFLFRCRTQLSVLPLGKYPTLPNLHPTTSPTEISGLEGGEKKMFFTERLGTKNLSVVLI